MNPLSGSGTVLVERYRLEERLSGPDPLRGSLWRAVDVMAGDLPVAIRQLEDPVAQQRLRALWPQLQSLLHPQLPRCGELLDLDGALWLVRDWQDGVTYDVLRQQRRLSAEEVLWLLRQILPVLAVLHGSGLVHCDLNLCNLLRRHSDGLPVLLDVGRLQRDGSAPKAFPWSDLHDLGVSALSLLNGQEGQGGAWPEHLELDAVLREVLERLLSKAPERRFNDAFEVLKALDAVALPVSVSKPTPPVLTPLESTVVPRTRRAIAREQGAEGRLWPVVIALALSSLVGSAIGWFLLPRTSTSDRAFSLGREEAASAFSLSPVDFDQRQQLFSRLRALQVNRSWFLKLVDASFLSRFPESADGSPTDSPKDAPLRRVWTEQAEEWLARIEQLPPEIRPRLGRLQDEDWEHPRKELQQQGLHPRVIDQLVGAVARDLLSRYQKGIKLSEPYYQLWIAAAIQSLDTVEVVEMVLDEFEPVDQSILVPAAGASLVTFVVPEGLPFELDIQGSRWIDLSIHGPGGQIKAGSGKLEFYGSRKRRRIAYQVICVNEGISIGSLQLTISLGS